MYNLFDYDNANIHGTPPDQETEHWVNTLQTHHVSLHNPTKIIHYPDLYNNHILAFWYTVTTCYLSWNMLSTVHKSYSAFTFVP